MHSFYNAHAARCQQVRRRQRPEERRKAEVERRDLNMVGVATAGVKHYTQDSKNKQIQVHTIIDTYPGHVRCMRA
jgi:hypothetical protein